MHWLEDKRRGLQVRPGSSVRSQWHLFPLLLYPDSQERPSPQCTPLTPTLGVDLASIYISQNHPTNHHGPLLGPSRPHHLCAPLGLLRCCSLNLPLLTSLNFVSHRLASTYQHLKCHRLCEDSATPSSHSLGPGLAR